MLRLADISRQTLGCIRELHLVQISRDWSHPELLHICFKRDSRRKTAPRCERILTVEGLAPVSACHRTLEAIGPATSNSFATLRPGSQGDWHVQPALLRKAVSSRGSCFNGRMLVGDYRGNNARACACPPMLNNKD